MFKNSFPLASACIAVLALTMGACAAQTDDGQSDTAAQEDLSSKTAHFETFEGVNGLYYFRLRAQNGQIELTSDGYGAQSSVLTAIADAQSSGRSTANYDVFRAANGQYGVNLHDWNGVHVASSETYASRSSATRAVSTMATTLSHKVIIIAK